MSFNGRLAALPPGPFARLATLLGDVKPGRDPITLAIGDPSGTVPDFVRAALAQSAASFGNYPAIAGSQDWRNAAGECATARNMWGLAPKADWIGASNWRRSGVVAAGSIRDRRWGMVGSVGG